MFPILKNLDTSRKIIPIMLTLTIDQVHPAIRDLVNTFLLKSKHPFEMIAHGGQVMRGEETYNKGVAFWDNNYDREHAGKLRIEVDNKDRLVYVITGREEVSPRRKTLDERWSKRTTDPKKVVKLMLSMITPYTLESIAMSYNKPVREHLRGWRYENDAKVKEPLRQLGSSHMAMVKELKNLKALGVNFVTQEFRNIAEQTLAYHEEHEYRENAKVAQIFVSYRDDGIHLFDNNASPKEQVYTSFDTLPEDTRGKVAFLKMLKDGEAIPEVGLRVDSKTFWVLKMSERVSKGNV